MIRRGVAGVRLCDRPACAHRWPCDVHGTASVGDYEHLGRHAGKFDMRSCSNHHSGPTELDTVSCKGCGHALCSCAPQPSACNPGRSRPVPDGWTLLAEHRYIDDQETYRHRSGASVWRYYKTGKVACYAGWGWLWSPPSGGGCARSQCKATRDEAMAAALAAKHDTEALPA